jgi:hypothetical protein
MSFREPQGLDKYARFDPFDTRVRASQHRHEPTWRGIYIYLLRVSDYESAHLIRLLNDHDYAERCAEGAAQVFPLQGSPLRSLSEVVGEREEWEVANAN